MLIQLKQCFLSLLPLQRGFLCREKIQLLQQRISLIAPRTMKTTALSSLCVQGSNTWGMLKLIWLFVFPTNIQLFRYNIKRLDPVIPLMFKCLDLEDFLPSLVIAGKMCLLSPKSNPVTDPPWRSQVSECRKPIRMLIQLQIQGHGCETNKANLSLYLFSQILMQSVTTCACVCAKSLQSSPTLLDPMDCSPPGSSVHGIVQVRILEWVAMPSSRGSS